MNPYTQSSSIFPAPIRYTHIMKGMKGKARNVLLVAWLALAFSYSHAALAATTNGRITGYVKSAATNDFLASARITVNQTNIRALTGNDGQYSLSVPPGNHTLSVSYTGLNPITSTAKVGPGQTVELNFELTSEIYQLAEMVVRTTREDDALSLQQQRYSPNLKTVLATDAHGAPADNPGELLQRMAGISTVMAQGEVHNVMIRGMGQEFAKMTVDGESIAMTFGNLNAAGRSFTLTEFATNNLSQIELIKAPTPDQDADSIAGTINLISKRHYDSAAGVQINATLSGLRREHDAIPASNKAKLGKYGRLSVSYNDAFGVLGGENNLGVAVDFAWSKVMRSDARTGPQGAASLQASYVNGDSDNPLNRHFATGDVGGAIEKINGSIGVDYKLGNSGSFIFAKASYTEQKRDASQYLVRTLNSATTSAAFAAGSTFQNSTVLPTASSRLDTRTINSLRHSTLYKGSLGGEFKLFDQSATLSLLGAFSHAVSKNPRFRIASAEMAGVGFQIDRRETSTFAPKFTQTAGPTWSTPASYRIRTFTDIVTKGAPTDNYTLRADFTKHLATALPVRLKGGVKWADESRFDQRIGDQWTYVGADGLPNSADDLLPASVADVLALGLGKGGYGPFPFIPKSATSREMVAPASQWKKTAAQVYSELTGGHARGTDMQEVRTAGYVMGSVDFGQIRTVIGVRAERTELDATSWIRNSSAAWGGNSVGGASVDPVVVAANAARAERSYVGPQRSRASNTEVFPGAHVVWEPIDGLLVRGSYNRSIARPNMAQLLPTGSVNEETMILTIGNPALKPYLSDNFELSVEKYIEPVGLIAVGAFQKKLTRYFRTFSDVVGPEGIDGAGTYAGFERRSAQNIGNAEVRGVEISLQQQFRSLPGRLSGLGAFANFTYLSAEGDFGSATITSRIPNMTPRTANAGISYVGRSWQVRPLFNWMDRTYRGTSGNADYDSASRTRVDVKMQYILSKRYQFELSIFNLTNQPDNVLLSSERGLPFVRVETGTAYSVGVTGRF